MKLLLQWSLALVVFTAGIVFSATIIAHQRARALLQLYESSSALAPDTEQNGKPSLPFASENEAVTSVFSAMNEKNPLRRAFEIYEALYRLDSAQLHTMADRIEALTEQSQRTLLGPLLQRWNKVDAAAAATWASTFINRYAATGQSRDRDVILAWSRAAPERALEEALRTSDQNLGAQMANAAASGMVGDNPAAIIERLSQLPSGKVRERALAQSLGAWADKAPAAAYAELSRLQPGRNADETRIIVMKKWAATEPAAALKVLQKLAPTLPDSLYGNPLVKRVAETVAAQDPQLALNGIAQLPENLRQNATVAALVSWAAKDGVAALTWAHAHDIALDAKSFEQSLGGFGGVSWNSLAERAMNSDKEQVIAWVRGLPPSEERSRTILSIMGSASPEQARELFSDLPGEWQRNAVEQIVWRSGNDDFEGTTRWALEMPDGPARRIAITAITASDLRRFPDSIDAILQRFPSPQDRDAVLSGAANTFDSEPRRAVEFATQIQNPEARERAFRTIAGNWLYRDRPAAVAWLAQTPEISEESKRVLFRRADDRKIEWGR
jgi:hypothetical protein